MPLAALQAPQIVARWPLDYEYVLGPSTTFGKDLMPRVAALLGVGQVSDLMAVDGPAPVPPTGLCRQRHR